jgi:hypothetical protein
MLLKCGCEYNGMGQRLKQCDRHANPPTAFARKWKECYEARQGLPSSLADFCAGAAAALDLVVKVMYETNEDQAAVIALQKIATSIRKDASDLFLEGEL